MGKGAVEDVPFIFAPAFELLRLNGIEIAPPGVAVSAPLGMQCLHRRIAAPQRHAGRDEAAAKPVEQLGRRSAQETLTYSPYVQFDNLAP
jgi:hypothetical protein